jgi:hypothetical protein
MRGSARVKLYLTVQQAVATDVRRPCFAIATALARAGLPVVKEPFEGT